MLCALAQRSALKLNFGYSFLVDFSCCFFFILFFLNSMIVCWESKCPFNILDYEAFNIRVVGKSRPCVTMIDHAATMPV